VTYFCLINYQFYDAAIDLKTKTFDLKDISLSEMTENALKNGYPFFCYLYTCDLKLVIYQSPLEFTILNCILKLNMSIN